MTFSDLHNERARLVEELRIIGDQQEKLMLNAAEVIGLVDKIDEAISLLSQV